MGLNQFDEHPLRNFAPNRLLWIANLNFLRQVEICFHVQLGAKLEVLVGCLVLAVSSRPHCTRVHPTATITQ